MYLALRTTSANEVSDDFKLERWKGLLKWTIEKSSSLSSVV